MKQAERATAAKAAKATSSKSETTIPQPPKKITHPSAVHLEIFVEPQGKHRSALFWHTLALEAGLVTFLLGQYSFSILFMLQVSRLAHDLKPDGL